MSVPGRRRRFWGWGWEDAGPSPAQQEAIAQAVAARLGLDAVVVTPPPRLEEIALPPPRIAAPARLAPICSAAPYDRAGHTYGKSFRDVVRAYRRDFRQPPDLVMFPRDEADVAAVLEWATGARVAVVPYGGGSSVVGGVEPPRDDRFAGVVSLDLGRLDRVLEVDTVSRAARIQAGALGPALEEQLRPHGLTLRHFPQSFEFSTLGGWIATRSGGHYATLYTHIDDFVEALGVIVEAWMRLTARPTFRAAASVTFSDFAAGAAAVRAIAQAGLYPANCRLLDPTEAATAGAGDGQAAVLLLAFEAADHPLDPWMARALECAADHGGRFAPEAGRTRTSSEGEREGAAGAWRRAFLDAPYLRDALVGMGLVTETFETAVTWDRFPAFHAAVMTATTDAVHRVCGRGQVTVRFTHAYPDGPAPYYTVLAAGRPGSQLEQWAEIKAAASEAILAAGGTITHHHAVGRDHRPWYDRERPAPFAAALAAAKAALDPAGILNPGVLIDA